MMNRPRSRDHGILDSTGKIGPICLSPTQTAQGINIYPAVFTNLENLMFPESDRIGPLLSQTVWNRILRSETQNI